MRIIKAGVLFLCAVFLCSILTLPTKADTWNKKTIVTFNDPVEIPGQVLPAGTYVFQLADSQSDRHLVEIWNASQTQLLSIVMAVPDYRLDAPDRTIFQFEERPGNSPMALRSWFYPGDNTGQHFVYSDQD